nr:ArdC family protein [Sulfobacillus thermotolerans]
MQQLLGDPEAWKEWASTMARFPTYSPGNALLIMAQRPDATYIAGYHAWQQLGRHVQKGERGITILAPVTYRVPTEEAEPPAKATESAAPVRQVVAFKAVTVFALEQTQGEPLRLPRATPLMGDTMGELLSHLMGVPGFPVLFGDTGPAYGVWNPTTQQITLRQDAAPDQHVKTLLHEWSHSLGISTPEQARTRHVGQEEVTAETTAYVMAQALGLDTKDYSQGYVAGWANGDPKKVAGVVQDVGRRVHHMVTQLEQAAQQDAALRPVVERFGGPQRAAAAMRAREEELVL